MTASAVPQSDDERAARVAALVSGWVQREQAGEALTAHDQVGAFPFVFIAGPG